MFLHYLHFPTYLPLQIKYTSMYSSKHKVEFNKPRHPNQKNVLVSFETGKVHFGYPLRSFFKDYRISWYAVIYMRQDMFFVTNRFVCLLQSNGGVAKWANCFQNKTNTLLVFKKFEYNWIAAFGTNLCLRIRTLLWIR